MSFLSYTYYLYRTAYLYFIPFTLWIVYAIASKGSGLWKSIVFAYIIKLFSYLLPLLLNELIIGNKKAFFLHSGFSFRKIYLAALFADLLIFSVLFFITYHVSHR